MKELYYHRTYVIDELDGYTYNVKIPDYLSFYLSPQTGIHIYTTNAFVYGAYACDIHIAENTICKVFADFLQGLTGSPMVYSTEETLELLRRYIDQI